MLLAIKGYLWFCMYVWKLLNTFLRVHHILRHITMHGKENLNGIKHIIAT